MPDFSGEQWEFRDKRCGSYPGNSLGGEEPGMGIVLSSGFRGSAFWEVIEGLVLELCFGSRHTCL